MSFSDLNDARHQRQFERKVASEIVKQQGGAVSLSEAKQMVATDRDRAAEREKILGALRDAEPAWKSEVRQSFSAPQGPKEVWREAARIVSVQGTQSGPSIPGEPLPSGCPYDLATQVIAGNGGVSTSALVGAVEHSACPIADPDVWNQQAACITDVTGASLWAYYGATLDWNVLGKAAPTQASVALYDAASSQFLEAKVQENESVVWGYSNNAAYNFRVQATNASSKIELWQTDGAYFKADLDGAQWTIGTDDYITLAHDGLYMKSAANQIAYLAHDSMGLYTAAGTGVYLSKDTFFMSQGPATTDNKFSVDTASGKISLETGTETTDPKFVIDLSAEAVSSFIIKTKTSDGSGGYLWIRPREVDVCFNNQKKKALVMMSQMYDPAP